MLVKTISIEIMKSFTKMVLKIIQKEEIFQLKKMFQDCRLIFIGDKFPLTYYGMNLKFKKC